MWGLLGGLAGSLLPSLLTFNTQRQQMKNQNRLLDEQRAMIGQAREKAGISDKARAEMLRRSQEALRSAQASRGIFESGVGAAQEAEQRPMWEQQMNDYAMNQYLKLAQAYQGMGGGGMQSPYANLAQQLSPALGQLGRAGGNYMSTGNIYGAPSQYADLAQLMQSLR